MLVLGIVTVTSIVGGFWLQQRFESPPNPYAQLGGDFTLMSASGPVSLSDYRGKVVMLCVGFTACPDVCPTDLSRMSAVFNALNPGEVEKVAGLFVSVTPGSLARPVQTQCLRRDWIRGARSRDPPPTPVAVNT